MISIIELTDQLNFTVDPEQQRKLRVVSNKFLNILKIGTDWLISHENILDNYQEVRLGNMS